MALSARNIALSEKHPPGQDITPTCAACRLATQEAKKRFVPDNQLESEAQKALAQAGLEMKNKTPSRHMVDVPIGNGGFEELVKPVQKPHEGLKFAGYVGCQTNRSFGIAR